MNGFHLLKNRDGEFVAAMLVLDVDCYSVSEARSTFRNQLQEQNWFEDQTQLNALEILKETAFSLRSGISRYKNIGIIPKNAPKGILESNIYRYHTDDDAVIITFDEEDGRRLRDECEDGYIIEESAEAPDPNY